MTKIALVRENGTEIASESIIHNQKYLGVVFSGLGYTYSKPLLYYSRNILLENGIDYVGIDYRYYEDDRFRQLNDAEKNEYFEADTRIVVKRLKELASHYEKLVLIGKSMGTSIIRRCIREKEIKDKACLVLMTPGAEWSDFIPELCALDNPTLVIASLEDTYYNVQNLKEIYEKKNVTVCEMKRGNHSLEVHDIEEDIERLKDILVKERDFIREFLA